MTQHLHCVLCHLRGEKEPWAKSCPDLLLVASLLLGEAVPSTGTPLCSWGVTGLVPRAGVPSLTPPLPSRCLPLVTTSSNTFWDRSRAMGS